MMRLTVVTTFGLIGMVAMGFLGRNLFSRADARKELNLAIFFAVFVPTTLLTFYMIAKSRRLSLFLDALSDENIGWRKRVRALRPSGGGAPSLPEPTTLWLAVRHEARYRLRPAAALIPCHTRQPSGIRPAEM
jgi:hypothetical protein